MSLLHYWVDLWAQAEEAFHDGIGIPPWIRPTADEEGRPFHEVANLPPGPQAPAMGMPESLSAYLHRVIIAGSPETVTRQVAAYRDNGLSHLHIRFAFGSNQNPEIYRRSLDLFAAEVMPAVGSATIGAPSRKMTALGSRPAPEDS